jgi:hypothetical protein
MCRLTFDGEETETEIEKEIETSTMEVVSTHRNGSLSAYGERLTKREKGTFNGEINADAVFGLKSKNLDKVGMCGLGRIGNADLAYTDTVRTSVHGHYYCSPDWARHKSVSEELKEQTNDESDDE